MKKKSQYDLDLDLDLDLMMANVLLVPAVFHELRKVQNAGGLINIDKGTLYFWPKSLTNILEGTKSKKYKTQISSHDFGRCRFYFYVK